VDNGEGPTGGVGASAPDVSALTETAQRLSGLADRFAAILEPLGAGPATDADRRLNELLRRLTRLEDQVAVVAQGQADQAERMRRAVDASLERWAASGTPAGAAAGAAATAAAPAPAAIAAAIADVLPAALASSLAQLAQTAKDGAEMARDATVWAVRQDLEKLGTAIDTLEARFGGDVNTAQQPVIEALQRLGQRLEGQLTALAGTLEPALTALADLTRRVEVLNDAVTGVRARLDDQDERWSRERVAADVSDRLSKLRDAAAGVGDAVRTEAQRRRGRRPLG
jgi:hypothetical protein